MAMGVDQRLRKEEGCLQVQGREEVPVLGRGHSALERLVKWVDSSSQPGMRATGAV